MNYIITYTIYVLIISVLMGLTTWKLFKKMGYNPLLSFVPFYNYIIVLKETNHSKWWAILSYLPIVGPIMMSVFHIFLMKKFGKRGFVNGLLTVVFAVPGFFTAVSVAFVVVFLATGLAEGFVALAVFFVLLIVSAMFIPFINVGT